MFILSNKLLVLRSHSCLFYFLNHETQLCDRRTTFKLTKLKKHFLLLIRFASVGASLKHHC